MVCPGDGRGGTAPYRSSCGPLCRTRDRGDAFSLCVPVFDGAAALSSVRSRSPGAGKSALSCAAPCRCARCPAGFGRPGVAALLRTLPVIGQDARAARPSQMARRTSSRGDSPFLFSHPSFLSWRRRALSACCAAGERQGSHGRIARGNSAAQKKTPTGMETGGRLESFYGCGARDQNSL